MTATVHKLKRRSPWEPVLDGKGHPMRGFVRHRPSGIIHVRRQFRRLGIPAIFRSTGEKTIGRAKSQGDIIIQQHVNKHLGVDDSHAILKRKEKTFGAVAREVLDEYTPTQRAGTQEMHRIYIGALIDAFGPADIDSITPRLFDGWIAKQRRSMKRRTFADYAKHMNLVMRYAYNHKYCTHLVRFKSPDSGGAERPGRVYTDAEITRLWDVMGEDTRDQFALCYESFMRLREALKLTWKRIDLSSGMVTLGAADVKTGSKTGRGRQFHLSPRALERMRARANREKGRSAFVFPSPHDPRRPMHQNKTAWNHAKELAGIKGRARWHDLRHTALSKALLEAKADPVAVSEYAGVSIRTIQAVYLHARAEHTKAIAGAISICGDNTVITRKR